MAAHSATSAPSTGAVCGSSRRCGWRQRRPPRLPPSRRLILLPRPDAAPTEPDAATRPSIAVLPFRLAGDDGHDTYATTLADALPHELIVDLSRLRWLFVTARGSSFRLRNLDIDAREVGRLLGVRYFLSGSIERVRGSTLHVSVELVDTRDGGVVWAEHYEAHGDDVHQVRTDIRAQILAALELRIPLHEATLARLGATESLDAWSAFHLGLQHVYRFNRADTAVAKTLFEQAVGRDPRFARAHAGLSFVHFQAAFLRQTDDVAAAAALARRCAERGLELDPLDPFVNFTMGRTYLADGRPGNGPHLAPACDDAEPEFRARHICAGVDRNPGRTGDASAANMSTSRCA